MHWLSLVFILILRRESDYREVNGKVINKFKLFNSMSFTFWDKALAGEGQWEKSIQPSKFGTIWTCYSLMTEAFPKNPSQYHCATQVHLDECMSGIWSISSLEEKGSKAELKTQHTHTHTQLHATSLRSRKEGWRSECLMKKYKERKQERAKWK